jgi:hypothetical protein
VNQGKITQLMLIMRSILQNYFLTGFLMLVISVLLSLIIEFVISFFSKETGAAIVGGIVAPLLIGQLYAYQFKRQMTRDFKLRVVGFNVALQVLLGTPIAILLWELEVPVVILGMLFAGALVFGASYYMIGSGERSVLRSMGK